MERRRALSAVLALMPLLSSRAAAQSTAKATVIGILDAGDRFEWWNAFREQLRDLGYVPGRNVRFEQRFAKGNAELATAFAKELVQLKVTIIVTSGAVAALAAQHATTKIPIVMASGADQVGLGLANSLARPGANITGVSSFTPDLMAKRLELLREIVPRGSTVAALWHRDNPPSMASVRELDGSAAKARVGFQSFAIMSAADLDDAFAAMDRQHVAALVVVNGPLIYAERRRIAELALKYKLPAIYGSAEYVDAGGLAAYGPSYPELFRHAALYVDKVLKGANPGDLPIELPTTFDLVLNANTARGLGITIPATMLARANRVIQ